jgi:hypothetical protein
MQMDNLVTFGGDSADQGNSPMASGMRVDTLPWNSN